MTSNTQGTVTIGPECGGVAGDRVVVAEVDGEHGGEHLDHVGAERVADLSRQGKRVVAGGHGVAGVTEQPQRVGQPAQAHDLWIVTEAQDVFDPLFGAIAVDDIAEVVASGSRSAAQKDAMPSR